MLTITPVLPTGTQNYNGQSVFSISPVEGLMFPGKAQEFTVTFSPDHESLYFSDLLQVVLFEKVELIAGPPGIPPILGGIRTGPLSAPLAALIVWRFMLEASNPGSPGPTPEGASVLSCQASGQAALLLVPRKSPTRSF